VGTAAAKLRDRPNSIFADADIAESLQDPTAEARGRVRDALDAVVDVGGHSARMDSEEARKPTSAENIANYEEHRLSKVYDRKPKTVLLDQQLGRIAEAKRLERSIARLTARANQEHPATRGDYYARIDALQGKLDQLGG